MADRGNMNERVDAEMTELAEASSQGVRIANSVSDATLKRLIEYLRSVGWTDSQIVELLDYIAGK